MLVQRFADGPEAPPPSGWPAAVRREFERVPEYEYAAPGGARWMTLDELAEDAPPAGGVAAGGVLYQQITPARGWVTGEGPTEEGRLPAGRLVLSVTMDVAEPGLGEFHGWYDEEHLPALLAVPEISAARRFRAVGGDLPAGDRQRFLALYELSSDAFLGTEAWARASANTPRTERAMAHASWASQLYRSTGTAA